MGDFDVDLKAWDIETEKFSDALARQMINDTFKATKKVPNVRELGTFRLAKGNNGYVVYVGGGHDGYPPEHMYVCKEADEIGDLITAHVVGLALDKS